MKSKVNGLLILSIIFNSFFLNSQILKNITTSFESYSAYYMDDSKTGNFNSENRFRSNNYLNLKSYINDNWNVELQIESYIPKALLNFSPSFKETGLSTFKIQYSNEKIDLNFGNFYEQFGSGMILRSWEDKSLGINNSIRGINTHYRLGEQINFKALYGNQKKGFEYSKGYILGLDTEFDVSQIFPNNYSFIMGLSYVGRNDNKTIGTSFNNTTNLYSIRLDFSSTSFYSNIELVNKSNDVIAQFGKFSDDFTKKGSAFLFNSGYLKDGFGIDFTFRRLENMSIYSERDNFGNEFNRKYSKLLTCIN